MSAAVRKLPITAAEYLEGELSSEVRHDWPEIVVFRRAEKWRQQLYTQLDTMVPLLSIDSSAPVSSFYQSNPFPSDVQRPWYHLNRIED